jgi:hypothetical protein
MYHHNPSEVWRERQIALLREAEHRRIVRQLREGRPGASPAVGARRLAALGPAISVWRRTVAPLFRA